MRRGLVLIALLGLVACAPPKDRIAAHKGYALVITFEDSLPGLMDQDRAELHAGYERAIRARLAAKYGEPVLEVPATGGCPIVKVDIQDLVVAAYPPKSGLFKGWVVDATVNGVLDRLTRNVNADANQNAIQNDYLDRYIARKVQTHRLDRLGYLPLLVKGELTYQDEGRIYASRLDGEDLLPAFQPLQRLGGGDPQRIRAEEARVLAEVVDAHLASGAAWPLVRIL